MKPNRSPLKPIHDRVPAPLSPVRTFLTVLGIVFAAETGVMFLLPLVFGSGVGPALEAVLDACLLTVISSPILWLVLIRPLRRAAMTEHARAASIIATAVDGIITIDDRGIIESFNPAAERIFGYSADEVRGGPVTRLIQSPLDTAGNDRVLVQQVTARMLDQTLEVPGHHKNGSEVPLALTVSEFSSAGRRTYTWIVRDLTERKRYEQQQREREAIRAEQLASIAQIATGVAHEIRNPLTSVKMLVQNHREEMESRGERTEDCEIIEAEIRRMERCLQTFLDFARPPKPDRRPLDLRSLVERTVALVSSQANRQGVSLEFDSPDEPVCVSADWEQIQQLLLNLALNALDAMPHGGVLEFEFESASDDEVELRVLDTGPGIGSDVLPRLFEPFVTSKETGLGLGLVLSRRIAQDHSGSLAGSNRRDGGACFALRLPRLTGTDADSMQPKPNRHSTEATQWNERSLVPLAG